MRRFVALGVLALASIFIAAAQGAPQASGEYIVVLKDGTDSAAIASKHKAKYGAEVSLVYKHALKGYAAHMPPAAASALAGDSSVAFVAQDGEGSVASCPTLMQASVVPQCAPTGIDRIDADTSSASAGDGGGEVSINVAVLDTGTEASHPDLNVVGGVNCTDDKLGAFVDPGKVAHGTHVGGTIGAKDNGFGVVGIAPGARLFSVRVADSRGGVKFSWLLCGLDWVVQTRAERRSRG